MNPTTPNVSYAFRAMFDRALSTNPELLAQISPLALVLEQRRRFSQDLRAAKAAGSKPTKTRRHRRARRAPLLG